MSENRFGGRWTEFKLICLGSYLRSYSLVMKYQENFEIIYIDPFCGPGNRTHDEEINSFFEEGIDTENRTSPSVALEHAESFDTFYFNDRRKQFVEALEKKISVSGKKIVFSCQDANEFLLESVFNVDWNKSRAVVFLDPFGLEVDWQSLEALSATRAVDIVMLLPTSSLCRMLPNVDLPSLHWQQKLDRFLGNSDWINFYRKEDSFDLFGRIEETRRASAKEITRFVFDRLRDLFFVVDLEIPLKNSKGSVLFHLVFMCASKKSAVQSIVRRIAKGAVKFAEKEMQDGRGD